MKEKILALLEQKKYPEIAALVKDMNPADAAVLLEELPQQSMPLIFRLLPKELAADAFAYMDGDTQELLIQGFTDKELDEVMGEMFLDDTVDLIEEMPANVVKRILRHVDEETRKMINQVLNYPKDSAGSHDDHGVRGLKAQHDRGAGLRPHPCHRPGQRDRLHLLCHRQPPQAGGHRHRAGAAALAQRPLSCATSWKPT